MVIDSISPTFSIPAAAQYFEISTDNGITYTDANIIEMNYYALNKMEDFTGDNNSMNLLFRKKSNITDEQDYRVTKILVNEASTFLPSPNTGLNVVSTSTQKAQGNYFAGRYATYNSVTTGGLNFSDFKIQSIQDSSMQMVFFINPANLNVTIKTYKVTSQNTTLAIYVGETGTKMETTAIIKSNSTLSFYVHCNFTKPSGLTNITKEKFEYGVTKADVLGRTQLPANPTQTGKYKWNINVDEIIWTAEPLIEIRPVKIELEGKLPTNEYEISVSGMAKFKLNSNGHWVWAGEVVNGDYVVVEHTAIYEDSTLPEEKWTEKTCWQVKNKHEGSVQNWGFEKGNNDGASQWYKDYSLYYEYTD